jgi:O-antigen/teichoic acid export membrane protein
MRPRSLSTARTAGRPFAWGIADQACASLASFFLTLTAARALGPSGLGAVFVGFSAYLAVLGLQRALITEPLVAASAASTPDDQAGQTRSALTLVVLTAALAAAVLAGVGLAVGGTFGAGIVAFTPWLLPVLMQDVVRYVLFRDGLAGRAVLLDAVWLAATAAWIPVALRLDSPLGITAGWGVGCAVTSIAGLVLARAVPGRPLEAVRWWRSRARALGSWLVAESVVYSAASYATVVILGAVLGSAALGGLRAAQSALMPLTLVLPALTLPGLPAMTRLVQTSSHEAARLAVRLGVAAATISGGYILIFAALPGALPLLFGHGFEDYSSLVWPLGVGQCIGALVLGVGLLLKASLAGRRLFVARTTTIVLGLILATWLGSWLGVQGAAWGTAAASAAGAAVLVTVARPLVRPRTIPVAAPHSLRGAR